ncbi:putative F-box protein [Forsythia ovata]|uniref:F-box protein n=1 Tax=Forsythia ovata TaxID=205694 RepID=A0ABD1TTS5_9LAMI
MEVLHRLPAKSLTRFKCVSKLWNSIISDSGFMKAHHRLPAKSLTRFKCVSKLWNSIISDSGFMKAHPSNSDGLLITFTDIDATSQPGQPVERFLRVFSDRTLHHQASVSLTEYSITQTINGLVCLYVNTDNLIFLCNIFTHDILRRRRRVLMFDKKEDGGWVFRI